MLVLEEDLQIYRFVLPKGPFGFVPYLQETQWDRFTTHGWLHPAICPILLVPPLEARFFSSPLLALPSTYSLFF